VIDGRFYLLVIFFMYFQEVFTRVETSPENESDEKREKNMLAIIVRVFTTDLTKIFYSSLHQKEPKL
jgi:hypothetical protein